MRRSISLTVAVLVGGLLLSTCARDSGSEDGELAARADDLIGRRSRSGSRLPGSSARLTLGRMALRESRTSVQRRAEGNPATIGARGLSAGEREGWSTWRYRCGSS
jgi:hypothetical protein